MLAERVDVFLVDREPGRRLVAAVRDQMLAAGGKCGVQIEPRHAPPRADARLHAQRIERDQDHRAVVLLGQPPATMPITPGCHSRSASTIAVPLVTCGFCVDLLVRRFEHAPLERLPLVVELVDVFGQLHRPLRRLGRQQLDGHLRLAEPARRVEPRADREADVFAGERRFLVEAGHVLQRLEAGHGPMPQAVEPVPHEHAVLVHERHDVGHRAHRGEPHGPHQIVPHRLADALGFARPLAQRPGELKRDRRAAEAGERIVAAGQAGMHDRRRARQLFGPADGGR